MMLNIGRDYFEFKEDEQLKVGIIQIIITMRLLNSY